MFTAAGDGKVRQHDPATEKLIREYTGPTDWLYAVAAHPASQRVAAAGFDGNVWVWDTNTGKTMVNFRAAPGTGATSR